MHNYYNIIPSVLLDILIIFLLEGIVFYKFLFPMEKDLAQDQLEDFNKKIKKYINDSPIRIADLDDKTKESIKKGIMYITKQEKQYLEESSIYFLIVFGLTCLGLFILVYIYYIICNTSRITLDWTSIFISLFFIVICIIGFEIIYFIYILLNKKINNKKIMKYFIEHSQSK